MYHLDLDTTVPLSLASYFAQWPLTVLQQKIALWPKKSIFPNKAPLYRNILETSAKRLTGHLDLQNQVNYDSFFYEFLIHGGFITPERLFCPTNSTGIKIV